jgi:hypothetical protein
MPVSQHQQEADEINRARQLIRVGKHSAARHALRAAVHEQPSSRSLRLLLAEQYREIDSPDQAGRWGILIDGWTTSREQDRLARLLASSRVTRHDVAAFLALPTHTLDEYPTIVALLEGPVAHYRSRYDDKKYDRPNSLSRFFKAVAKAAWVTALVVVVVSLIALAIEWILTRDEPRVLTHVLGESGVVLVGFALLMNAAAVAAQRDLRWAATLGVVSLLITGTAIARIADLFAG